MLSLLFLLIAAIVFINTDWGQNIILRRVTSRLSKNLQAKIKIKHVSFSLFNKMNLADVLVEDQQKDTLLYAGKIRVRITDWFFLKDKIELHYAGLEDATIKLNRSDSVWNYQFLVDYFAGGGGSNGGKKETVELNLKKIDLKNITLLQQDKWRGEDKMLQLETMSLDADEINFATRNIEINSLRFTRPLFHLKNYPGLKPKKKKLTGDEENGEEETTDTTLKWNAAGWLVHADRIEINNGNFINEKQSITAYHDYFDGRFIDFSTIDGVFTDVNFIRDSISASLKLKTKERSGFEVKSMKAEVKFTPQEMAFDKMEIITNNSIIRDYFRMSYSDISDMDDFIHKVRMQARFTDAEVDSDDIAFFAPAAGQWKKKIKVNGPARGTVDDLFANEMTIEAGNNTFLNGDISLTGLPDINKTFIDFKANKFRTNYVDAATFFPVIRKTTAVQLQNISYLDFDGSFTGFLKDFVTYGTIRTNLGTLTSDLNMKLPDGKEPLYSGNIASQDFQLGQFINNPEIGAISFSGQVKGSGVKWNSIIADVDATVNRFTFKNYQYENIKTKGNLNRRVFTGNFSINDSNAIASMDGIIDFRSDVPKFNFLADVGGINLAPLHILDENYSFKGKLDFDFSSSSIDNFIGTARISSAEISKDGKSLPLDSLVVYSRYIDGTKHFTINSKELEGSIVGNFSVENLPDAYRLFLNKYYPSYIRPPVRKIRDQAFSFSFRTNYISDYIRLFDSTIDGFNNSEISGRLNTVENVVELNTYVPSVLLKGYEFQNVNVTGKGTLENLGLTATVDYLKVNDSISFPFAKVELLAKNDSTKISLVTESSNKNIQGGSISALVTTFNDGLAVRFDTSQFVLNGKRWSIEKDGELELRSSTISHSEIVLKESNQEVVIKTLPSDIGNWNDLKIDLKNFNIGDVTTLLVRSNKIEGLLDGNITIEDPVKTFNVVSDIQTDQLRLDGDSLGQVKAHVFYENKTGKLTASGKNLDPDEKIEFDLALFLKNLASNGEDIITITPENYPVDIVKRFIGTLFTDLRGYATGQLKIIGQGDKRKYVGKARLHDAGLKVIFTQCFYKINDSEINFREDALDLGTLKLVDTVTNNTATLSRGIIKHDSWKNMQFDILARVDNNPMLLLNTTAKDNSAFYGYARGTGTFSLTGPQANMRMRITGKASETDSSYITIPNSTSRESGGLADFLIERKYGREISDTVIRSGQTNLTYDVELSANPMVNVKVILDELTNDEIRGRGEGNLHINSGTSEPLSIRGRYNINEGNYKFTFQSFFKKPFELKKDADNYIEWTGDPYHPTVKIDAVYTTTKKVDFSPLLSYNPSGPSSAAGIRDYVYVIAHLTGDLFKPDIKFALDFPAESPPKKDVTVSFVVDQLQQNENELNKHVAFLVVFNSFAPTEVGSSLDFSSGVDLVVNSISGFLSGEINRLLNNFLTKKLNIEGLNINFSGSLYDPNLFGESGGISGYERTDFNLVIAKSILKNRAIITFEGTADVPIQSSSQLKTDLLKNVTTEFLINKSGTVRATIFYKENIDFLTNTASTGGGIKSRRYGGSLAYRKEGNRLRDLFTRKKKLQAPAAVEKKDGN